jgi:hypothetical protein
MGKHSRRPPGDETTVETTGPPPKGLRRDADGRVVLEEVAAVVEPELVPASDLDDGDTRSVGAATEVGEPASRRRHPARRALDAARRGRRRADEPLESVGGPIQPTPTVYFGRPPGTENRRAGGAALVGAIALLLAAVVPWATRAPDSLGATSFGWRDPSGGFGPGVWMFVFGLIALGLAASALAGSTARILQVGDVVVGVVSLAVALVEWLRIRDAAGTVADLTDGRATLSPGWGALCAAVGGAALLVAALVHRDAPPAWRQG